MTQRTKLFLLFNAALFLLTGITALSVLRSRIHSKSEVLVVPLQVQVPNAGVAGVLTLGMERGEVLANLGPPRISRQLDFMDQNTPELVNKVFAWVTYGEHGGHRGHVGHDDVSQIDFDLAEMKQPFVGEQQVSLVYKGRQYLLKRGMTAQEIEQLFNDGRVIKMSDDPREAWTANGVQRAYDESGGSNSNELYLTGTGVILKLDATGLAIVSITVLR